MSGFNQNEFQNMDSSRQGLIHLGKIEDEIQQDSDQILSTDNLGQISQQNSPKILNNKFINSTSKFKLNGNKGALDKKLDSTIELNQIQIHDGFNLSGQIETTEFDQSENNDQIYQIDQIKPMRNMDFHIISKKSGKKIKEQNTFIPKQTLNYNGFEQSETLNNQLYKPNNFDFPESYEIESTDNQAIEEIKNTERIIIRTCKTFESRKQVKGSNKNQKLQGFDKVNLFENKFKKQWSEILKTDKTSKFKSTNESMTNQTSDFKQLYIKQYGVEMEVPGYYFSDSKFVPFSSEGFVVTIQWHIIPAGENKIVQTTYLDMTYDEQKYSQIYSNSGQDIILSLLKPLESGILETLREIQLYNTRFCIIKFSKSGKLFSIYDPINKNLKVYNSLDMINCFDQIEKGEHIFQFNIKDSAFDITLKNILKKQQQNIKVTFDNNDLYVAVNCLTHIHVFSLINNDFQMNYAISEQYSSIHDIVIDSTDSDTFKCQIACKQADRKLIEIFDIGRAHQLLIRSIIYQTQGKFILVKISDDFEQVVFSNGKEHYILKGMSQNNFPQIRNKAIRGIVYYNKTFYFVASNDYDRDIDILNSSNINFNASIVRMVEPGMIKVFDFQILPTQNGYDKGLMKILINQDSYLFLDTIDKSLCYQDETRKIAHIHSNVQQMYRAYGFNWPYFSYIFQTKFIYIMNAFNPQFIQRYELPQDICKVFNTFLTDTHDLFCIAITTDNIYKVFNIDLDSSEPSLIGPIFQYSGDQVNNQTLSQFHIRASSRKEKVNLNKGTIALMMHGNYLYGWWETQGNEVTQCNVYSSDQNSNVDCSNFYYFSDDIILYMTTQAISFNGKEIRQSTIKMLECQFTSFRIRDIYQDKDNRAEILNFGVDNTRKRLLILTGIKNKKNKRDKFVTVYDFENVKVVFSMQVHNKELIGRLKSNLYNFVEGHIYYNNQVIKIRYDLLENKSGEKLNENQIFDQYSDILNLKQSENVHSGFPLQTCLYNRLLYIIRNKGQLKPRRILILPYLHERKIYLNKSHSANQFYTIVKHQNGKNYIICLCINSNKMYIYTETGILVDQIFYTEIARKYGKPVEISENGLLLIFSRSSEDEEIHLIQVHIHKLEHVASINIRDKISKNLSQMDKQSREAKQMFQFWNIYLQQLKNMKNVKLSYLINDDGEILIRLQPLLDVSHNKMIKLQNLFSNKSQLEAFANQKTQYHEEFESNQQLEIKYFDYSFFLFFPNYEIEQTRAQCSYCFSCSKLGQELESKCEVHLVVENAEHLYYDGLDDEITNLQGVSMNQDFVFFWNFGQVWKLDNATKQLSKLSFYVDENEYQTSILKVRTGSDQTKIAIRVTQSISKHCIIIWDIERDIELESFDISVDAVFFQDRQGNQFVAENDYLIDAHQTCKLKQYRLKASEFTKSQFSFGKGYRVDDELHNFVLFRNFINLSFSYMTFVIKDNFDKVGFNMDDYLFDPEGYDWILGKNTIFTQGTLVSQEYDKLNFILQNYLKLDIVYLDSLLYKNQDDMTPLHIATQTKNTRMVNLILIYLSKLDKSGISMIKDIFKDLINYGQFPTYLSECPFQTVQMINKQTLILKSAYDNQIVKVSPSRSSYIDNDYFEKVMGEQIYNKSYTTYAVKIKGIKADWIMNELVGFNFLMKLLKTGNREVFESQYIKIVIQFLYESYSNNIWKQLLPLYILHLIFVNVVLFLNEQLRDDKIILEIYLVHPQQYEMELKDHQLIVNITLVAEAICCLFNFLNIFVFIRQTINLGWKALRRMWSIVDFVIIICNLFTSLETIIHIQMKHARLVECLLFIFMCFKSLYFLRLVPEIAPLVDIIFVIIWQIRYFILIFIVFMIGFCEAFWILGRHRFHIKEDFETYSDEELPYGTILSSLSHVYQSALWNTEIDFYLATEMTPYFIVLFVLMIILMTVHLLNMLIAMMKESYQKNNLVAESKKKISQLEFIVDNWWIDPIINKDKIVYFVAAIAVEENNESEGRLKELSIKQHSNKQQLLKFYKMVQNIQYQISQLQFEK